MWADGQYPGNTVQGAANPYCQGDVRRLRELPYRRRERRHVCPEQQGTSPRRPAFCNAAGCVKSAMHFGDTISHQSVCWECIAAGVRRNDSYCRITIIHAAIADVSCLNVAHAQRDGVVIASSRDAPIHGKPNPDVPNHDTRRASPMDTGRSKGSRTQDNRRTPSEDNNRRTVVVEGRTGRNSVVGLHTGAARPGLPQPREWRPTES